jgi:hypothetical protein
MRLPRRTFLSFAASAGALSASRSARAQVYPSRPITLIVPFAAGGPTDTIARIVTEGMRTSFGQPIIIENVGGAYRLAALMSEPHPSFSRRHARICRSVRLFSAAQEQ